MSQSPEAMKVWREAHRAMRNAGVPGLDEDDRASSAASVIEAALQKARDEEREAVVVWLEAENKRAGADGWNIGLISLAIARGKHRREG